MVCRANGKWYSKAFSILDEDAVIISKRGGVHYDGVELRKYDGRIWLIYVHILDCTLDRFNSSRSLVVAKNTKKIIQERGWKFYEMSKM